jgi:hypothetical protein
VFPVAIFREPHGEYRIASLFAQRVPGAFRFLPGTDTSLARPVRHLVDAFTVVRWRFADISGAFLVAGFVIRGSIDNPMRLVVRSWQMGFIPGPTLFECRASNLNGAPIHPLTVSGRGSETAVARRMGRSWIAYARRAAQRSCTP